MIHALVPYYNYIEGVRKIEQSLSRHRNIFFCTVSNDSNESECEIGEDWIEGPRDGAVKNWNFLLSKVKAKHFVLIHQDEELVLSEKISTVTLSPGIVYVCDLSIKTKKFQIYLPNNFRCFLINNFPKLIYTINFIGPTATLIIPNNDLRFNEKINWLVDVDYYYRLRQKYRFEAINYMLVKSDARVSQSITNSGKLGGISKLRKKELQLLGIKNYFGVPIFLRIVWHLYRMLKIRKNISSEY